MGVRGGRRAYMADLAYGAPYDSGTAFVVRSAHDASGYRSFPYLGRRERCGAGSGRRRGCGDKGGFGGHGVPVDPVDGRPFLRCRNRGRGCGRLLYVALSGRGFGAVRAAAMPPNPLCGGLAGAPSLCGSLRTVLRRGLTPPRRFLLTDRIGQGYHSVAFLEESHVWGGGEMDRPRRFSVPGPRVGAGGCGFRGPARDAALKATKKKEAGALVACPQGFPAISMTSAGASARTRW